MTATEHGSRGEDSPILRAVGWVVAAALAIFLHTGRRTVDLPATDDTLVLWGMLDDSGSRYLVVPMDHEYAYLLPTGEERSEVLDRARPGHLRLVHTYPMGRIFQIDPP
ncbi:MAG: hypothetical protein HKN71_03650 [Gemmatimonadetes bacterium]|nr:hypothetical protein [Gemmatimonadota bacterium]